MASPTHKVVIVSGPGIGREASIPRTDSLGLTVGLDEQCGLSFSDIDAPMLEHFHATFSMSGNRVSVEPCSPGSEVFVNSAQIEDRRLLLDADSIQLGKGGPVCRCEATFVQPVQVNPQRVHRWLESESPSGSHLKQIGTHQNGELEKVRARETSSSSSSWKSPTLALVLAALTVLGVWWYVKTNPPSPPQQTADTLLANNSSANPAQSLKTEPLPDWARLLIGKKAKIRFMEDSRAPCSGTIVFEKAVVESAPAHFQWVGVKNQIRFTVLFDVTASKEYSIYDADCQGNDGVQYAVIKQAGFGSLSPPGGKKRTELSLPALNSMTSITLWTAWGWTLDEPSYKWELLKLEFDSAKGVTCWSRGANSKLPLN